MSQTLKFGNKTWATKVGSTLAYNDENGNYKPLPFAFTRSTSATRVNKEGLIEVVTNDRPRIDYTDTDKGVALLENSSTNLITYSEDFSQSAWTKTGATTVTSNTVISPDGTQNASTISGLTGSGSNDIYFVTGVNPASKTYSASVYLKGNGTLRLQISNNVNQGIGEIITLTSDWKRHTVTGTFNSTSGNLSVTIDDSTATATQFDVWGAMLEENSVASSYIPTQGSASTRVAETANGAGNSEVFNDSEGVLFADIAANADDNSFRQIALSNGTYLNSVRFIYRNAIGEFMFYLMSGGVEQLNETIISGTQKTPLKVALQYKLNNCSCWYNGFKVATDISSTMPIGLDRINFAQGDTGNPFYGKTKEIGYYDTILTDLELETLTSYKSWTSMVNELNLNIIYNG